MIRPRNLAILVGAAAATVAILRHGRRATGGQTVAGGVLIGHAGVYDTLSRLLLGPLIDGIAADVAASPPPAHRSWRWAADPATCRSGWPARMGSR